MAILGYSEYTFMNWAPIREPYVRKLLNKRATAVAFVGIFVAAALSVLFIFVPGTMLWFLTLFPTFSFSSFAIFQRLLPFSVSLLFHAFRPHRCSWAFRPGITASGKQIIVSSHSSASQSWLGFISFFLYAFLFRFFSSLCHNFPSAFVILSCQYFLFSFCSTFYPSHNTHFLHYLCMLDDVCFLKLGPWF